MPIYPTRTIGGTGVIEDVEKRIDSSFKKTGSCIIAVGTIPTSVGASHYLDIIHNKVAGKVPSVDLGFHKKLFAFMADVADNKLLLSAHDIAEGGIAVALFEMGRANNIGCDVNLPSIARADALLFGEAPLMLIEVGRENYQTVLDICENMGLTYTDIGKTTEEPLITIHTGSICLVKTDIARLNAVYEKALPELVS